MYVGLVFSNTVLSNAPSNLEEHCFTISPLKSIAMREDNTTPRQFLEENPGAEAAINGPYFDTDNKTKGVAFLADNFHFATEKPEDIRGYFSVNRIGD